MYQHKLLLSSPTQSELWEELQITVLGGWEGGGVGGGLVVVSLKKPFKVGPPTSQGDEEKNQAQRKVDSTNWHQSNKHS